MALDGSTVRANAGILTYTPSSGTGGAIGFTAEGVTLDASAWGYEPIVPEDLGEVPLDFIELGGPIFVHCVAWQWDAATRAAIAKHMVSTNDIVLTTTNIGRKMSDLAVGTLAFVPNVSGHTQFSAGRAVPLLSGLIPFAPRFRKRGVTEWGVTFAILPPAAGGTLLTFSTYTSP